MNTVVQLFHRRTGHGKECAICSAEKLLDIFAYARKHKCHIRIRQDDVCDPVYPAFGESDFFRVGGVVYFPLAIAHKPQFVFLPFLNGPVIDISNHALQLIDFKTLDATTIQSLLDALFCSMDKLGFSVVLDIVQKNNTTLCLHEHMGRYCAFNALPAQLQRACLDIDSYVGGRNNASLLIDLTHFQPTYNGTHEYGKHLVVEILELYKEFGISNIALMGNPDRLAYHGLPVDNVIDPDSSRIFDIAFRPSQFRDIAELQRLMLKAKRVFFCQLDIIGIRCRYIYDQATRQVQQLSLSVCDGVTTISNYSRDDIVSYYALNTDDLAVRVTPLASFRNKAIATSAPPISKLNTTKPYYLVMGNTKYDHKMIMPVYKAINDYVHTHANAPCFVFLSRFQECPDHHKIICLGDPVTEDQLKLLISRSKGVIYPSVYEGFGLPIGHAALYEKPALLWNSAISKEVAHYFSANAYYTFNGLDDFMEAMAHFIQSTNQTTPYCSAAHPRTWAQCAYETLEFITHCPPKNKTSFLQRTLRETLFRPDQSGRWPAQKKDSFNAAEHVITTFGRLVAQRNAIALYGSGKHTKWLEQILPKKMADCIVCVFDDKPDTSKICFGKCPVASRDVSLSRGDVVILSSDCHQAVMKKRCAMLFKKGTRVVDIYKGLPPGPYKR